MLWIGILEKKTSKHGFQIRIKMFPIELLEEVGSLETSSKVW